MDAFSPLTCEALGWYVYLLTDPRDGTIFYVGKGCGNRAFAHAAGARDRADHPELQGAKAQRIDEIERAGHRVCIHVLRHQIASEDAAYEIEAAAIDLLHYEHSNTLLNGVGGRGTARGLISAVELEVRYGAAEAPPLGFPVLLVSLNRHWHPGISEQDLYDRTRFWWKANGQRRDRCRYVMGVHNGIVRSVYKPVAWHSNISTHATKRPHRRWGFDGEPAPEMSHFLRTSVKRFLKSPQWSHRYAGTELTEDNASPQR